MPLPRGSPRERSAGASSCQDPSTHRSAPGVFLDSVTDRSWWIESNDFATTANSVASAKTTPTRLSWPTLFTHYLEGDEDECSRQGAAGACELMRIVSGQSRTAPVRRRSGDVWAKLQTLRTVAPTLRTARSFLMSLASLVSTVSPDCTTRPT